MRRVYLDSSALIALIWTRDRRHAETRRHFEKLLSDGARFVTSDAVIGETATRLRYDAGSTLVAAFRELIDGAAASGSLEIVESSPQVRGDAFDLMAQYGDVALSYADCVGAVVARRRRTDAILALDNAFRILGFAVEP